MTIPDRSPSAAADLERRAVETAIRLAGIVRGDGSAQDVQALLGQASHEQLMAVAVAAAAMVDDTRSPRDLLVWLRGEDDWTSFELREAHAAHARGETGPWAVTGERVYQRLRGRRRTRTRGQVAS